MTTAMRDILHREMNRDERALVHQSRLFPGHEARAAWHSHRIRTCPCECGSGLPYGKCCIDLDLQKSEPGVCYTVPQSLVPGLGERHAIENAFRLRAFHSFYGTLDQEDDLVLRFVRALVASSKPVDDHKQIVHWHKRFRRRHSREGQR